MAYVIAEPCVDVHDRSCVDECDLPEEWRAYATVGRESFGPRVSGFGAPGGASRVDAAGIDHPLVAQVPREAA